MTLTQILENRARGISAAVRLAGQLHRGATTQRLRTAQRYISQLGRIAAAERRLVAAGVHRVGLLAGGPPKGASVDWQ